MDASNPAQVHHQGADPLGTNHPQYAGNQTSASPHDPSTNPYPFGLRRFYSMREDPWVPIHAGQPMQGVVGGCNYNTATPAFHNYRNRGLPSESDTCAEDSAYGGSRVPQSVENASTYDGDTNPEAHNAAVLMEGFHMGPQPITTTQLASWPPSQPPLSSTGENKNFCAECDTFLRTKSELKKHNLRHEKPFRCDVPRCSRTRGFGTRNDLDRHKRSVHADLTVSGSCYVCPFDPCASRDPPKIWPRADNFRSHLRRIHNKDLNADADLEEYVYRDVQVPSQPTLRADLQGVGGGGLSYMIPPPSTNMQRPVENSYSAAYLGHQPMDTSPQDIREDFESLLQDANSSENAQPSLDSSRACQSFEQSINSTEGSLQSGQQVNGRPVPFPAARFPSQNGRQTQVQGGSAVSVSSDEEDGPFDAAAEPLQHDGDCDSPLETTTTRSSEQPRLTAPPTEAQKADSSPNVPSGLEDILKQLCSESTDKVVECLKKLPRHVLARALGDGPDDGKSSGSSQESASQKSAHPCSHCNKTFNRQCELKKHLKRHEKPYGCTFRDCPKSFGSKNDWKRHESSQHWQLETWKCEEMDPGQSEPCGRVCQRRESFKHHLIKDHEIKDSKQLEEKFEKCRLGRHCKKWFWCGFCEKIKVIEEEGANAWTARCNHIDDHFCGRVGPKKSIDKWKHPSGDDEQAEQDSAGSSTTASSKQSSSSPESFSSSSSSSSPRSRSPSSLKRKTTVHGDGARHKKTRQETYMWACCACKQDNNLSLSTKCLPPCDHQKCDGCMVSATIPQEL